jgi:uncharacterized repeat protein (TIGR01451 family)
MEHVIRGGGSDTDPPIDRTRVMALVTTFFLLVAGIVVAGPGAGTVSAGSTTTGDGYPDDAMLTLFKTPVNEHGGNLSAEDFQLLLDGQMAYQNIPELVTPGVEHVISEVAQPGYVLRSIVCLNDETGEQVSDDGTVTLAAGEHVTCEVINDDIGAGLTVVKKLINDDGGNEQIADFALQVNGVAVQSGELVGYKDDLPLAITETQLPGWIATNIHCVSNSPDSYNNVDIDNPDVTTTLASILLSVAEAVVCTITNDDVAPTVTVHKVVVGGTKLPSDFRMTVNFDPVDQDIAIPTLANTSIEVSELADPAYVKTGVVCTDNGSGLQLIHPLVLDEAQNATCTVTNASQPATITLHKDVTNLFGGKLVASDFHLTIDGTEVAQGTPTAVAAGPHVVSELLVAGYQQVNIDCIEVYSQLPVGDGGDIAVLAGQSVDCTVFNSDIGPTTTSRLTLTKRVITNDGGTAVPDDFHLQIDGSVVPAGVPQLVQPGLHIISEEAVPNYRLVAITCTDDDNPGQTVVYNAGVTLAPDQHVSCLMTNDDFPIDLAITKSDDGQVKVAGGAAFDYTITVDNLGPFDALATEAFTLTDKLPTGFAYVSFPTNCFSSVQTLTCAISPSYLHVADSPFVLTLTVRALADAAIGTYINMAYINTPADPACVGLGCVPICSAGNNNVACESTVVTRQASIAVNKFDDVTGAISPGATYSYFLTATNPGPSTFLADLKLTDDFPAELQITSVVPGASWRCNMGDPLECDYLFDLQAGETTPAIEVRVRLDPNFLGNQVVNAATAIATVDPTAAAAAAPTFRTEAPGDPGTVVTDTDDETTVVVRQADLAIDKSVSQTSAATGDNFNWVLAVTNHGPNAATNLTISDTLPAQFEVLGAFPSDGLACTNTISSVQCTAPSLLVGETLRVVVQVRVVSTAAPGIATNTATVTADSADPDLTNNTDSASIDITAVRSAAAVPAPPASASNLELPRTGGSSPAGAVNIAALLLAAGFLAQFPSRRRRTALA